MHDVWAFTGIILFLLGILLGQAMHNGKLKAAETRYERCIQTRDEYHEIIKRFLHPGT